MLAKLLYYLTLRIKYFTAWPVLQLGQSLYTAYLVKCNSFMFCKKLINQVANHVEPDKTQRNSASSLEPSYRDCYFQASLPCFASGRSYNQALLKIKTKKLSAVKSLTAI